MSKSFTIDQVSWHTSTPGDPEPMDHAVKRFFALVNFLQTKGLTTRQLARDESDITNDFAVSSSDLTNEGLTFMRLAYGKWIAKIDHGMDPADVKLLEQALNRLRE